MIPVPAIEGNERQESVSSKLIQHRPVYRKATGIAANPPQQSSIPTLPLDPVGKGNPKTAVSQNADLSCRAQSDRRSALADLITDLFKQFDFRFTQAVSTIQVQLFQNLIDQMFIVRIHDGLFGIVRRGWQIL